MATAGRSFEVKFTGNTSQLTKSFRDLEKGSGALGKTFGGISKIGTAAFSAIGISSAAAAVAIGVNAVKAAVADQESQRKLAKTLQNTTRATDAQVAATEKWITQQQFAYGISDSVLRPALENLVRATGDLSKAQGMMALAQDIAAGTGKDLTAVSLSLAKSYGGNFAALSRLGIVIPDNIKKSKDYGKVTEYLNGLFGGQAATAANTYAGRMQRLKERVGELQETIGALLLPLLSSLADYMEQKIVPAVERVADAFGISASNGVKTMRTEIANILVSLDGVVRNVYNVVTAIASIMISTKIVLGLRTAWLAVAAAEGATATAAVIAAGVIKRAMISTGIGALIVGFGFLIDRIIQANLESAATGKTMRDNAAATAGRYRGLANSVGSVIPSLDAVALAATRAGDAAENAAIRVAKATGKKYTPSTTVKSAGTTGSGNIHTTAGKAARTASAATNKFAAAQASAAAITEKLNTRLGTLRERLANAKQAYADYAKNVADAIRGSLNYQTASEYAGGFIAGLQDQARKAITFGSKIATLVSMGLNQSSINQILATGAETGTKIADEIIAGGAAAVTKVNQLTQAVDSVAVNVGKVTADRFYKAGVTQAQAMLDGFIATIKASGMIIGANGVQLPSDIAAGLESGKLTKEQQTRLKNILKNAGAATTAKITGQQYASQRTSTMFPVSPTSSQTINNITVTTAIGDPVAIGKTVVDALVAYQKKNGVIPVKTKTA